MIDIQKIDQMREFIMLLGSSVKKAELEAKLRPMLERFREAVVQELVGVDMEPVAYMYQDDHERMTTTETFCNVYSVPCGSPTQGTTSVHLFTADQLAGAVLRERERCAAVCEGLAVEAADSWSEDKDTEKAMRNGMLNFVCVISGQCAAAIRSGE